MLSDVDVLWSMPWFAFNISLLHAALNRAPRENLAMILRLRPSTNLSPSASATYSLATIMVLSGRIPRMTSIRCNLSSLSSKSGSIPSRSAKSGQTYVCFILNFKQG